MAATPEGVATTTTESAFITYDAAGHRELNFGTLDLNQVTLGELGIAGMIFGVALGLNAANSEEFRKTQGFVATLSGVGGFVSLIAHGAGF